MALTPAAENLAAQIATQEAEAPLVWAAEIPISLASWSQYRLSANDGKKTHVSGHNDKVQFWKELARVVAKQKRAPRMSWGRVVVVFQFPKGGMTREVANLQPTIKALVDGLVVAGVFKDDNDSIVFGQDARRAATRGPLSATILVYGDVLTP